MKAPCNPDHNGECLVCDCWLDNCAYDRFVNEDYAYETKEQLEKMFSTYSIPIYENGTKTKWTIDGVVGDDKYNQLIHTNPEGKLPYILNVNTRENE